MHVPYSVVPAVCSSLCYCIPVSAVMGLLEVAGSVRPEEYK